MAGENEPFALAEPMPVDVAAIEHELEEIWRVCAQKEGTDAVLRAAAFNLIYVTSAETDEQEAAETVAQLTAAHPSRAILLRVAKTDMPQRAWVTAYCHRPAPNSPQLCSEFIRLDAAVLDVEAVTATVLALRLSGLPTALIWDASLVAPHPLLTALARPCERVITMLLRPCAPAPDLDKLLAVIQSCSGKTVVTDLSETIFASWQRAVAETFDGHGDLAQITGQIHIFGDSGDVTAQMLLLGSWLSLTLGWMPTARPQATRWQFDGGRELEFHINAVRPRVEFHFRMVSEPFVCAEPVAEVRVVMLLLKQLQIWGRDELRDTVLRRSHEWLEAVHA